MLLPQTETLPKEFVRAGIEVSSASGGIGADFDAGRHGATPPDILKMPAPLIATVTNTSGANEAQGRISPITAPVVGFGIDKARISTSIPAARCVHALILARIEVAGHVPTSGLARTTAAYVVPAVPARESNRDGRIAVGVRVVRRLDGVTAVAAAAVIDQIRGNRAGGRDRVGSAIGSALPRTAGRSGLRPRGERILHRSTSGFHVGWYGPAGSTNYTDGVGGYRAAILHSQR